MFDIGGIKMRFSTRPKYTLRKLTIGLVSVFFGTVVIVVSRHAHAAVVDPDQDKQELVIENTTEVPSTVETTPDGVESSTPSTNAKEDFDGTKEEAPPAEAVEPVAEQAETSMAPVDSVETGADKTATNVAGESANVAEKDEHTEEPATETVEKNSEVVAKVRAKRAATSDADQVVDQINWDAVLYKTYDKNVKITGWDLNKGGYDVLLPNTWDFQQKGIIGQDGVATISSGDMHKIVLDITDVSKLLNPDQKSSITISHNSGSKLVASNEDWNRTFSIYNERQILNSSYKPNLISIDINHLDVSKVTNISGLFFDLNSLKELKIEDWNIENVTNLSYTFYNTNLSSLDLNKWNTENVTNLNSIFLGMRSLSSLKIDKWNTSNVIDITRIFVNTSNLKYVDISNWDTSNVKFASYTFAGTNFLNLDISRWDTSSLKIATGMFQDSGYSFLDVSNWNTSQLIDASQMFFNARYISNLDVSKWDTSNLTTIANMFNSASSLENLDVSRWDTHNIKDMQYAFRYTPKLQKLDVSKWDTSNVINLSHTFSEARSLKELDVSKWDTSNVTNMNGTFWGLKLSKLDVSNWNTSKTTIMSSTFGNTNLENLDVSKWDTSGVVTMAGMFSDSNKISFLDVSKWNTSNVKDFSYTFSGTTSLENLDISKWNTSSGINFKYMFNYAKKLSVLDVDNFNMDKATNIWGMFSGTESLKNINVSKWDVSNVKDMPFVFHSTGIKNLDLSTWNTKNVEFAWQLFKNTKTLETINLSNLNFENADPSLIRPSTPWGETFEGSSVKVIYADNYQGPLIPGYETNGPLVIITNNTTPITNEEEWNRTNKLTFEIDNQINGTTSTKTDTFSSIIFKSVDDLHSQINDKINNLKAQLEDGGKNEVTITLTSSPADLADEVNGIYKVVVRAATTSQEVRFVNQNNPSEIISSSSYQGKIGESEDLSLSVPERWKLADGQTIPTSITFTKDAAPIIIGLVHDTVLIDQPVNAGDLIPNKGNVIYEKTITNDDLTHNVTRTITIHNEPNSSTRVRRSLDNTRTIEETVSFKKTYTLDLVTMELTDNGFELAPGSAQGFTAFTPTNYAGYNYTVSPNSDALNAVNRVAPTTSSFNVDIFYEILEDTQVIEFVDKDTNEIVGPTYSVTGQVSKTIATPKMPVPDGWELVDGQTIPTEITIGPKYKPIKIYVEKVATPVTPTPEIPTPDPTITPEEPTEPEVVTTEDIKITDTDDSKTEEETTTSKEHLEVKDLDHKSSNGKTTKAKLTIVSTSANPDSSTASQATLPQTGEKSRLLSLLLGLSLSALGLTTLFKKRDNG